MEIENDNPDFSNIYHILHGKYKNEIPENIIKDNNSENPRGIYGSNEDRITLRELEKRFNLAKLLGTTFTLSADLLTPLPLTGRHTNPSALSEYTLQVRAGSISVSSRNVYTRAIADGYIRALPLRFSKN